MAKEEDKKGKEDAELDNVVVVEDDRRAREPSKEEKDAKAREDEDRSEREADDKEEEGLSESEKEAIRERKREERKARKERQRLKAEEKDQTIVALQQELQQVRQHQLNQDRRSFSSDVNRIDAGLQESLYQMEEAKKIIAQATAEQKGEALVAAQEAWYDARKRYEQLAEYKNYLARQSQQAPAPDPVVISHARNWMTKNRWYNPKGADADSQVALGVDKALAAEGYNPRTAVYWQEFDKRLQKYLPHRFKDGVDNEEGGDEEDGDQRGSPTSGSGREQAASGKVTYRISAERVAALKEAGMWDDPKMRAKMAKKFAEYDKAPKE